MVSSLKTAYFQRIQLRGKEAAAEVEMAGRGFSEGHSIGRTYRGNEILVRVVFLSILFWTLDVLVVVVMHV